MTVQKKSSLSAGKIYFDKGKIMLDVLQKKAVL